MNLPTRSGGPLTAALITALIALLAIGAVAAAAITRSGGLPGQPQAASEDEVEPNDPDAPVDVTMSPSAEAHPQARAIADLLSRYFTAINRGDYDAWLATVSVAQSARDRDSWTLDYSTTHDSDIYISDIRPTDPLSVRLQFVSHQAVEFAPPDLPAECVRWDVTYEVRDEGVGLRVGLSVDTPAMAPC